jgi:tetratricopeptide (TPR) repeat protein
MIEEWRETFRRNPSDAVADLISGRAGLGSGLRLDVPELLYQAFPDRADWTAERARLDETLLRWLVDTRKRHSAEVARLGYAVYGKRLCDALIALQLLNLPLARERIRADPDSWLRWLRPLRLAPERDPALECWRLLTRGQSDGRHSAAWLQLAEDPRPEYLTVALSGLQRLPNEGDARPNQILMLHALLRHAVGASRNVGEARNLFDEQFAALRGQRGPFPHSPEHWREVLAEALRAFERASRGRKRQELVELIRTKQGTRSSAPKRARIYSPVPLEEIRILQADIRNSAYKADQLANRLFTILEQDSRYARVTGDSDPFVRTLSNLGSRLLRRHRLGSDAMRRLGLMIEHALAWAPMNAFCWTLWANWFAYQGRTDAQEWTLREAARLFPDNEPSRVELARLLIRRGEGHWDEAERWLREAAQRNPDDEPSRVVMAGLRVRQRRLPEAVELLSSFTDRHPQAVIARRVLERLQGGIALDSKEWELPDIVESELPETTQLGLPESVDHPKPPAITESEPPEAADSGLPESMDHLEPPEITAVEVPESTRSDVGEGTRASSVTTAAEPMPVTSPPSQASIFAEIARRGRLSAEFNHALTTKARGHVAPTSNIERETANGDPLAGFYSQWLMPETASEPPPHAWAWNACRFWQRAASPDEWRRLEERFSEVAAQTSFLGLLGSSNGIDQEPLVARWRARFGNKDDELALPVLEFIGKDLQRLSEMNQNERADIALAIMASGAERAPEFAT